jgi:hypothetical protein
MPHLQHFDYLQIKCHRLLGWLEDVQVMKYWPVCWMHMEGELILIIDFISRLAEDMLNEVDRRAALKKAMSLLTSKVPALTVAGAKAEAAADCTMVTDVISDTRSVLLLSGISVFCIGTGLFSMAVADASTIKVEHLHDSIFPLLNNFSYADVLNARP